MALPWLASHCRGWKGLLKMVRGRGQQPLTQASLEAHQKSEPSGDDEPKLAGGRITEELMAGVRERGWPHLWKALEEELRTSSELVLD